MPRHKNRIQSAANGRNAIARESMEESFARPARLIREYPASASLTSFVIGCCAGVAAALVLIPSRRERHWYETLLPPSIDRDELLRTASRIPNAVRRRFSHR